jgi:hypothetical protein
MGHAVAQLVEALRYKPKGRRFDSHGGTGIFHWPNTSGRTMVLGFTQPLTYRSHLQGSRIYRTAFYL